MNAAKLITLGTTTLTALLFTLSPVAVTGAYAYDDVDFVCDTYDGEDYCVSVDQLKIECPIVDPDNELEICAGLNEDKVNPRGVRGFSAADKPKSLPLKSLSHVKKTSKSLKMK